MAKFEIAFKFTSGIEKGYTIDNGGPTYRGIRKNGWVNTPEGRNIWAIIEKYKPKKKEIINDPRLDSLIFSFYKKYFWDKLNADNISNQVLANLCYDFYVNSYSAIPLINEALKLPKLNVISSIALKKMNDEPGVAYLKILEARKSLYEKLLARATNTGNKKVLANKKGWFARLDKFPKSLMA